MSSYGVLIYPISAPTTIFLLYYNQITRLVHQVPKLPPLKNIWRLASRRALSLRTTTAGTS